MVKQGPRHLCLGFSMLKAAYSLQKQETAIILWK